MLQCDRATNGAEIRGASRSRLSPRHCFNVTAPRMARKSGIIDYTITDAEELQCDRATNGAEMTHEANAKPKADELQCDRVTNGAEMVFGERDKHRLTGASM